MYHSEYQGHMPLLVNEKIALHKAVNDEIFIIAVGGDGTLKEVITGIVMSGLENVNVGYIPSGTANIIAKELGIPFSPDKACEIAIKSDNTFKLQLSEVNEEYFLFTCGVGFDGETVKNVNLNLKKILAGGAYILSGLKTAFSLHKLPFFDVFVDNKKFSAKSVIVNRAKRYAANIEIFKNTSLSDNRFEILIFRKLNIFVLLKFIFEILLTKRVTSSNKDFLFIKGREITISNCNNISVQIDGDYSSLSPETIRISSKYINIIIP